MKGSKIFAILCLCMVVVFVLSSGCTGVQMPNIQTSLSIQKPGNSVIDPHVTQTPVKNVTVTETTKPKFVYV